jgi:hypothetical protein
LQHNLLTDMNLNDGILDKDELLTMLFSLQAAGFSHGFGSKGDISQKYYAQAQIVTMIIEMIIKGNFDYVPNDASIN